ncbi:MAG: NADH-quinone oxidoreductase subunit C [Cytophagales bacterium]|nr:NADH-quinone oxidoreductase subunit C [Cytophaga sp.]
MGTLTNQYIIDKLQARFGDVIQSGEESYGMLTITFERTYNVNLLKFLYEEKDLGFTFLTDLTGIHYPEGEDLLGVVYHLHNLPQNVRLRLKTFFPKADPTIDSATVLFESANWMERETYDFFGILFKGHPNLIRILNVDDLGYFPMRKEYALEDPTRHDKDDSFFGR